MNPQRIEELRKKLRDGRPVRVVNGQVTLDEASTNGAPPPTPPGTTPHPIPAQGVQVKPHEWGASVAPGFFYDTRAGEARVFTEQALLSREYPHFELDIDDDGTPFAHGLVGPNHAIKNPYHVLVVIPPAYGNGARPLAYILSPEIRSGAPHRFEDGSLCLDHSGAFSRKSTLVTFLAWVSVWLVLYEDWLETGKSW